MIYLTSDLHFCHDKPFLYEQRGFENIDDHNKQVVANMNSVVTNEDELYILGDVIMGDQEKALSYLKQLNGKKTIILGNHDTNRKIEEYKKLGIDCVYAMPLKYGKYRLMLCHYPMKLFPDWSKPVIKSMWCLCGHVHTKNKYEDIEIGSYHVELDAHNNMPVSIEEVLDDLRGYKCAKVQESGNSI